MFSPRLGPLLIPETTRSGRSSSSRVTAIITLSHGVPSIPKRLCPRRSYRIGRRNVIRRLAALCSVSGATVHVRPTGASARSKAKTPGASMPSSLVIRIRGAAIVE